MFVTIKGIVFIKLNLSQLDHHDPLYTVVVIEYCVFFFYGMKSSNVTANITIHCIHREYKKKSVLTNHLLCVV